MQIFGLTMFVAAVTAATALVHPVVLDGPVAELNAAAVEISDATSTICSAGNLAPEEGHDQAAGALLLELEQYTADMAEEVHTLWVNASRAANSRKVGAHLRSPKEATVTAVDPHKRIAGTSVATLEKSDSIIVNGVISRGARWNLSHNFSKGGAQGNLTVTDVQESEKPKSKKSKSVPGLQTAKATILQAMQHVQSAASATLLGNGAGEDMAPTALLVMDRTRELYNMVEVMTARVAGGKDVQLKVEQKLQQTLQRISKKSADLGYDALAMTRELRLVKHLVREAVGGSTRRDITRAARESLKEP